MSALDLKRRMAFLQDGGRLHSTHYLNSKVNRVKFYCLFIFIGLFIVGCNHQAKPTVAAQREINASSTPNVEVALNFINAYVKHCNSRITEADLDDWIYKNPLLTSNFKTAYKRIYAEAWKNYPEYGLGFDAILDGQDYPDNGFVFDSLDRLSGYVILRGKGWKSFQLIIKMKIEKDHWLVDGSGIVNIPEQKHRKH